MGPGPAGGSYYWSHYKTNHAASSPAAKKETDAEKIKRYEAAFDQILARPSYPVAIQVAWRARWPDRDDAT